MVLVRAVKLSGGVVQMARRGHFADAENASHLPRRLAFHRPAQRLALARAQREDRGVLGLRKKDATCSVLRMDRKEGQFGGHATHFARVSRQSLVSVDTNVEVKSPRHVESERNPA